MLEYKIYLYKQADNKECLYFFNPMDMEAYFLAKIV